MLCHICNKATAQISDSETTGDENFVRDMAACRFFLPSRFSRWPLQSMRQADPCAILPVESSKYRRTGSSASPAVWQGTCLFGRDTQWTGNGKPWIFSCRNDTVANDCSSQATRKWLRFRNIDIRFSAWILFFPDRLMEAIKISAATLLSPRFRSLEWHEPEDLMRGRLDPVARKWLFFLDADPMPGVHRR